MTEPVTTTVPAPPTTTATATTAAPRQQQIDLRFSARDLLNTAIFVVIYAVAVFAVAMIGIVSPLVMLLTLPLAPIVAGIPYLLFLTRVRHPGMLILFGAATGAMGLMTGHPWQSAVVTIAASALAEVILWTGGYRSTWAAIWAYTAFSTWFVGPWIPFILDPAAYLRSHTVETMGEAYVADFERIVTVPVVLIMVAATVVCGFLGGLLGTAVLRKHFRKAGLA